MVFNELIMTKQFPHLEIISYSDILHILYRLIKKFEWLFLVGEIFNQVNIAVNMISNVKLLGGLMCKRNKKS